jgi:flotillin
MKSLSLYAKRVSDTSPQELDSLVKGIIEGETRVVAARLSIEDMFSDRLSFKKAIVNSV